MHTWQARAIRSIAGGCLTFSKSRRYYVDAQPSHVYTGDGNHLILPDSSIVLDTVSGLGANLVGCCNSFSLPTTLEVEFAERLLRRVPLWKDGRVKIVKTGTEACMAALRFGRAASSGIALTAHYHGWSNEFISTLPPALGCSHAGVDRYDSVSEIIDKIEDGVECSCVIIEPVELDANVKHDLIALRRVCDKRDVLLIFDEVITGFRWHNTTVSQDFGVTPDLLVMGKALGGGHPLGVVMGPSSIMDIEGVFVSGTFAGESSALYAGIRLMDECTNSTLNTFWEQCQDFHRKMSYHCAGKMDILGYGTRMVFKSPQDDGLTVAKYMQEMYTRHKILIGPVMFPKVSWTATEYTKVLDATIDVMRDIDTVELVGEKPRPMFKR